jgi:hypothetical protein
MSFSRLVVVWFRLFITTFFFLGLPSYTVGEKIVLDMADDL